MIEDPTIYVLNKMTDVLKELRVEVNRYNIFEDKNAIATLPSTLKGADGVILASTVEWFGIGGYMQQFLDMCWLYADKQELSQMYMLPVVMATTYGERDAEVSLVKAWETLGGIPIPGLVAYVENPEEFEQNKIYTSMIEKKTETLYRSIHQKTQSLPTSNLAVKASLLKTKTIELTPQESEQLSKFVSDETYMKQQKEDIEELSAIFKKMLNQEGSEESGTAQESPGGNAVVSADFQTAEYVDPVRERTVRQETSVNEDTDEVISALIENYKPEAEFIASYAIIISDRDQILHIEATPDHINCFYAATNEADVILRTTYKILSAILEGKTTFQKGFMAGEISAKGNFKTLRMLDTIFRFSKV